MNSRPHAIPLVAMMLALVVLSGCLGAADSETVSSENGGSDEPTENVAWRNLTWGVDASVWEETFKGTFAPTDSENPWGDTLGAVPGASEPERRHDVSDAVPIGLPVYLEAEFNAEMQEGDLDFDFEIDDAVVWDINGDAPFGGYTLERWVVVRNGAGPVEAVVTYDENDGPEDVTYNLRVRVETIAESVPPGLALITPFLAEGVTLRADVLDDDPDTVLGVWDPADRFLGYTDLTAGNWTHRVPDDGPPGEYVLVAGSLGGAVHVQVQGGDLVFAPRIPDLIRSEGETVFGADRIEWTYPMNEVPLVHGIQMKGRAVNEKMALRIESPAGTVRDFEWEGPWTQNPQFVFTTWFAEPTVVAGDYHAVVDFGTTAGANAVEATPVSWTYER